MDSRLVVPYAASHIVAVLFVLLAWRLPNVARWTLGAGFVLAGFFNIRTVLSSPDLYVQGFGPYAIPAYRQFIYGVFARHTAAFVLPIACGQIVVGVLAFAPPPLRSLSYVGAIIFLVAITPLGIGSAAPATLIFAVGIFLLLRQTSAGSRGARQERMTAGEASRVP